MYSRGMCAILVGCIVILAQHSQVQAAANPPATVAKQIGTVETKDAIVVTMLNPDPEGLPEDDGLWDDVNEFVFDDSQTGYCLIRCECTYMPDTATEQGLPWAEFHVKWSLTYSATTVEWGDWDGTTFTTLGQDEWGKEVWARISGLPATNAGFGDCTVIMDVDGVQVTAPIQIFFNRDAKNHPGDGSGITPNWYFYWGEAIPLIASCTYKEIGWPGVFDWSGTGYDQVAGRTYISKEAVGPWLISDSVHTHHWHKIPPPATTLTLSGIDMARHVAFHEESHDENFRNDWGGYDELQIRFFQNGPFMPLSGVLNYDFDRDTFSDTYELGPTGAGRLYEAGRVYDYSEAYSLCRSVGHAGPEPPTTWTPTSLHRNDFDICVDESEWSIVHGIKDNVDWASPGRQHATNGTDD